jgi:cytochrome c oxidase subunit I
VSMLAERPKTARNSLSEHGLAAWVTSTNHKRIGILYMTTSVAFFVAAGLMAVMIRLQLMQPGMTIVDPHMFAELFTMHGTTMIFFFVVPFAFGLANYLIPLQIGAPDMAFPRMNLLSYWLFLFGGLAVFSGFLSAGGAAAAGWYAYAPLSDISNGPGSGQDLWVVGLLMSMASGVLTAINFVVTTILFRAPGMTMWRMPIFTWEMLATSLLVLMAFPPLVAVLAMTFLERRMGGQFFNAAAGGTPLIYQHLFWFFGHPEVYVMILPYFGVISEIIPVFSRKRIFGYVGLVISAFAIAGLSMGVWAHHMFTTGVVANPFFSAVSFLIAVPTGIKFFNWIATMWGGRIVLTTPMLFSIGFLLNFLIGGITGVMIASPPIDYASSATYFIVAHFHYVIGGGSMFAIFAAIYFWFPKIYGFRLDERLGKISFWLMFVGFNLTFFPMHLLGMWGMPRRIETYPALPGWGAANLIATIGSWTIGLSVIALIMNVVRSTRRRTPVGDDPWEGGNSLEWATSSPPPELNFREIPPIRSERPAFDLHYPQFVETTS